MQSNARVANAVASQEGSFLCLTPPRPTPVLLSLLLLPSTTVVLANGHFPPPDTHLHSYLSIHPPTQGKTIINHKSHNTTTPQYTDTLVFIKHTIQPQTQLVVCPAKPSLPQLCLRVPDTKQNPLPRLRPLSLLHTLWQAAASRVSSVAAPLAANNGLLQALPATMAPTLRSATPARTLLFIVSSWPSARASPSTSCLV